MKDLIKEIEKQQRKDVLLIEKQMQIFEALTKKRIELIKTVMEKEPSSIRELATIVERDVKNVFNDLKILKRMRIVKFIKKGRCSKPRIRKKIIVFSFKKR